MIKIGYNTLPLTSLHAGRGTGMYTRSLLDSLKERKDILVTEFTNTVPKDVDVVHYPFFDPFFYTLPLRKEKPTVVTVHDLIPLVFPSRFPRGIRGELKWQIQKMSLKQSSYIITDSIASKNDIERIIGFPKNKISVVYLAPHPRFVSQTKQKIIKNKETYHLPDTYLLYVGDVNWNKNIPSLLRAVSTLSVPLVLVGKAFLENDSQEIQEINTVIDEEHMNDRIYKLGFVPDEDLPAIYSGAEITVVPSIAEGFGLPVLEAMGCDCPVACSNVSSLVEIAGPSYKFDPTNTESITKTITELLSKDRKVAIEGYSDWVKQFSWQKTAEETVHAYTEALAIQ
jgi:glycosyltransferase involved in cell wall biosynthesis